MVFKVEASLKLSVCSELFLHLKHLPPYYDWILTGVSGLPCALHGTQACVEASLKLTGLPERAFTLISFTLII